MVVLRLAKGERERDHQIGVEAAGRRRKMNFCIR
jgi:hypothetical protein